MSELRNSMYLTRILSYFEYFWLTNSPIKVNSVSCSQLTDLLSCSFKLIPEFKMFPTKLQEYTEYVADALEVVEFKLSMYSFNWYPSFNHISCFIIIFSIFPIIRCNGSDQKIVQDTILSHLQPRFLLFFIDILKSLFPP